MKTRSAARLVIWVCLISGCGSGDPFDYVKVSGKVTYDDGTTIPASFITVTFEPIGGAIDAKTHPRPAEANVNVDDGTFTEATSYKYGDGIVPGKHKVLIRAFDADMNQLPVIPARYGDLAQTPFEVSTDDVPFEFTIARE